MDDSPRTVCGYDIDGLGTTFLCATCMTDPQLGVDVESWLSCRKDRDIVAEVYAGDDDSGWLCSLCVQPMDPDATGEPDPAMNATFDPPAQRLQDVQRMLTGVEGSAPHAEAVGTCGHADPSSYPRKTRHRPPTVDEINAALEHLPERLAHREAASVHLALPVEEAVGISAWVEDDTWHYRGHTLPFGPDPAQTAVALITAGQTKVDRYLDLTDGCPASWCKPLRSGPRQRLFGSDLLLGGRIIAAALDVPASALRKVAEIYLAEPDLDVPLVLTTSTGTMLVDGGDGWLMIRRA